MLVLVGLIAVGKEYWDTWRADHPTEVNAPADNDEEHLFLTDSLWVDYSDLDEAVAKHDSAALDSSLTETPDTISEKRVPSTENSDTISEEKSRSSLVVGRSITNNGKLLLDSLFQGSDTCSIRVVHYGDSQIEEDRMSMSLRRNLQARYGGGGVGLLPLFQTVPSRTVRQTLTMNGEMQAAKGGPKRYLVYGPKKMRRDTNLYGPMGQVAVMDDALVPGSEDIVFHAEMKQKKKSESYFSQAHIWGTKDSLILLPDSSSSVTITLQGKQEIYGISLETPTGVQVDNIPMRGCSGYIFCQIDSAQLARYYAETNTRLIILQFGGNMIPHMTTEKNVNAYVAEMRRHIRYLKQLAPQAALLFIGPSDMCRLKEGVWTSYEMLPNLDAALRRACEKEDILYWSLFESMGGAGAMESWMQQGKACEDGIHFTPKGAAEAGNMLWNWMR